MYHSKISVTSESYVTGLPASQWIQFYSSFELVSLLPYGNYYAAWRAMERLYKEGRIRAIGVTSFSNDRLIDLVLHNEVRPAVNQIETHPFFVQETANQFMKKENIQHEAWAPFAEGHNDIFRNPVISEIARKYGRSVGQVILRWHMQKGFSVIPGASNPDYIHENIETFDFALSNHEMERIHQLNKEKRYFNMSYEDQVKWFSQFNPTD